MEAWTRLRGAIVYGGLEVDCLPIIEWLSFVLTLKTGDNKSPLDMLRPNAPLEDLDILSHWNNMLTHHLPGMEPALQSIQGLLIATHIGDVSVEMRGDRESKDLACQADAEKRVPDLLGFNLTYPLLLRHVANH